MKKYTETAGLKVGRDSPFSTPFLIAVCAIESAVCLVAVWLAYLLVSEIAARIVMVVFLIVWFLQLFMYTVLTASIAKKFKRMPKLRVARIINLYSTEFKEDIDFDVRTSKSEDTAGVKEITGPDIQSSQVEGLSDVSTDDTVQQHDKRRSLLSTHRAKQNNADT